MLNWRIVISITLLLGSGCTTTPGSNISSSTFKNVLALESRDDIEAARILITPETIKKLNQNKIVEEYVPPERHESDSYAYRIGAGDVLSIVVWDHPELTAPFGSFNNTREQGNVVREDGTIYYPFIGTVNAVGRSALEIRHEMEARLAQYIEKPQVDVRVAAYRSQRFFIAGSVVKPGAFPISDVPVRVVDAINLAGGLTDEADLFDVRLTRGENTSLTPLYDIFFERDMSGNAILTDGDVLHVAPNETRQVFLLGEVVTPQSLRLTNRPLSLTQALAMAGGTQEARADGRGVYVIRQSEYPNVVNVFQLDIAKAWMLALGDQFMLEPRDIIYVAPAPITRWNRWVSNVLPSLQGLFNIDRIGQN